MPLTRRQFLQWAGATGVGAVVFNGCVIPDEEVQIQSPLELPEDLVTGRDNFYATSYQSGYGSEGLQVRVMEGRAKKVEGNPGYPLNGGAHSARAEALLQALYHPDRLRGPVASVGARGRFQSIGWNQALGQLTETLRSADPSAVLIATGPVRGLMADVVKGFGQGLGARVLGFEPIDQVVLRGVMRRSFGQDALPVLDIARTDFLLNFGTDFLGTWLDPVHFSRGYGAFRQGEGRDRGYFVHVGPHFSMTAASADEWVYVTPGAEGLLAMAMAHVIVRDGLGDSAAAARLTGNRGASAFAAFAPARVARQIGVPEERITSLAHQFASTSRGPSLAIGGGTAAAQTNGSFNLTAIYALNYLVGSVNRPGGLLFNPTSRLTQITGAPLREWTEALGAMSRGEIEVVVLHDADLVHGLPGGLDVSAALRNVPSVVSLTSFLDDTAAAAATLILPTHTPLEDWGSDTPDPGPGYTTVALQQPVVVPFTNTMSAGDILLRSARVLEIDDGFGVETTRDALRTWTRPLQQTQRGLFTRPTFEEFWNAALQNGGWWDASDRGVAGVPRAPALPRTATEPRFSGAPDSYPFHLIPFESNALLAGQTAHLPWLQAAPDPVTTVTWGTWVELNPRTAESLGIRQGDVVRLESSGGRSIDATAYLSVAAPPDVVAVPLGQGHDHSSSFAAGRGSNPLSLIVPMEEEETGALAWGATRVRVIKTVRRQPISKMEGIVPAVQLADDKIIHVQQIQR